MDANIVNLRALFQQQVSYRIPQFQRPYAWGEHVQWKPLWDDIRNIALRVLNKKEDEKIRPHFMGAIVLQQQKSNTGEVAKRLVVDGQQRLTTLQLLIKATEQVLRSQDDSVRASRLQELTTNQESHWGGEPDNQTKIRQSNLNDQKSFQEVIRSHDSDKQGGPWAISQAFRYLKVLAKDWLDDESEGRIAKAVSLEAALTEYLEIAVIDLDEDEKPHIIFETLNARNEPLKQSDLIKNTVMYEANVIDDDQKARDLWGMFDDEWWRESTHETGLDRIHIDRFLNYWMMMRALTNVSPDRVAAEFRNYIEKKHVEDKQSNIESVTEDIRRAGIVYKDLERIKIQDIKTFLSRMKTMGLGAVTPLLLWLYTSEVPSEQLRRCIEVLESYLVRRMLCGLRANSISQVLLTLSGKLNRADRAYASSIVMSYLKTQTGDGQLWPDDRMLYEYLTGMPMKGTIPRRTMVLEAVELSYRSDKSEPLGQTDELTIEHIMPQKWEENWPLSGSTLDKVEATMNRNKSLRTIGNLTLVTEKLNPRLSNKPWIEKRKELHKHSSLFLNKTLLDDAPDVWDEATIERRGQFLVENILKIWPSGDAFMESVA